MGCHKAADCGGKRLSEDSSLDRVFLARCSQPDTDNTGSEEMKPAAL
jgi:hypothetical protein